MRILVIEDNRDLAANLYDFLEAKGHVVDIAGDGITGLHLAVVNDYDAIVLDLMLPGMDGVTLCRKLCQEAGKQTRVLMLTARDSLDDKIIGLESGADDYVVKPFAMREVEARLRTLARRGAAATGVLVVGDLQFDPGMRRVSRAGRIIELPPIPLKMLEMLMRRSPQVVWRRDLEQAIWGETPPDSDVLRSHMHVLRAAIDRPFEHALLRTVRGVGYQLSDEHAVSS
jgi:DNA-binding response OmpR family regulator